LKSEEKKKEPIKRVKSGEKDLIKRQILALAPETRSPNRTLETEARRDHLEEQKSI
jgi:hypothetical protein